MRCPSLPRLIVAACIVCAALAAGPTAATAVDSQLPKEGAVFILSDDNFDWATATGVWMVDIFAPWCSHCQQMEPAWQALAAELKAHNIKVAKIDGTKNRVLMKRFSVLGFPSIYLLKEGSTWQYTGTRTVADMKNFALQGYKSSSSLAFHKAPNSALGRMMGLVYSVPSLGRRGYVFLKEEKGFSDTAIISGVLLVPLTLGAIFICVLDALYSRQQLPFEPHEHAE